MSMCTQEVLVLKAALDQPHVSSGTGYYIRESNSSTVYAWWRDKRVVMVMSTAHPGQWKKSNEKWSRMKDEKSWNPPACSSWNVQLLYGIAILSGCRAVTENDYRNELVLQCVEDKSKFVQLKKNWQTITSSRLIMHEQPNHKQHKLER